MAKKNKTTKVIVQQSSESVDVEKLAMTVAQAVAREMMKEFKKLPLQGQFIQATDSDNPNFIDMNKIIPMSVDTIISETNLENMAKDEEVKDSKLEESKNKLAKLKKNRSK